MEMRCYRRCVHLVWTFVAEWLVLERDSMGRVYIATIIVNVRLRAASMRANGMDVLLPGHHGLRVDIATATVSHRARMPRHGNAETA